MAASTRAPMLQVSVNIIGEHAELDDSLAQPFVDEFEDVSDVLEQASLPRFTEPRGVITWGAEDDARDYDERIPVRGLHLLRRAYALMRRRLEGGQSKASYTVPPITPSAADSTWQPYLDAETAKGASHLCCHSDRQGTYLPLEAIQQPIAARKVCPWRPIPGDSIGSSLKLLDELIDLAPCLGVRLEGNESLPKSEAARLAAAGRDQSVPLHRELQAWLTLHEAAELSLSYGTAIHFSSSGG